MADRFEHRRRRGPLGWVADVPEYAEATLAVLLSATLSVVVPTICVLGLADSSQPDREHGSLSAVLAAALLLLTLPLSVQCLFLVGRALTREPLPFGPAVARLHPRWPALLRPPIALYWLCHFLVAALLAHGLHVASGPRGGVPTGVAVVVAFALTAAANVYLLFAIAAVAPKSSWIDRVWRSRLLLDAVVTLVAFFSARHLGR